MDYLAEQKQNWINERQELLSVNSRYRYTNDGTWYNAIDIFNNIIKFRYIDPIDAILNLNLNIGEGIFILQNQVILIEILATFKAGKIYNKEDSSGFFYNNASVFIDFTKETELFRNVLEPFNLMIYNNINSQRSYLDFYLDVRCGLLHEGILKNNWDVNNNRNINANDLSFVKLERGERVIYRNILQTVIKEYLKQYIDLLKNSEDKNIRINFARRLDHHFNITEDYFVW